jgi:hypothetical protein
MFRPAKDSDNILTPNTLKLTRVSTAKLLSERP